MDEKKVKAEKLIEKMTQQRGYIYDEWRFAAQNDPDFVEAYNNLYACALNAGEALGVVERELIACGILCFRHRTDSATKHMVRAIKAGATKQQILEAIETCIVPGGALTFLTGLEALMQALKDCEEQGIEVK